MGAPASSVRKGTEVSMTPISSTRKTRMLGRPVDARDKWQVTSSRAGRRMRRRWGGFGCMVVIPERRAWVLGIVFFFCGRKA